MDMLSEQYGYDQSIFVTEVPDYFNCMICSLVLRDPVQILSCGHKMCSACFERIKTHSVRNGNELRCPIDRELYDVSDVREDICSKRIVGNMVVRCYYHEKGCQWTGDLREVDTHTDLCQFKPLQQKDSEALCSCSVVVKELTNRVEQCESTLIDKDKQMALLKQQVQEQQQMREEMQSLKEQMSQRDGKNMGLEQRQQQQQQKEHEKQQQLGIADLQQKNKILESQMSALSQENVELKQGLQLMQQQHDKLQQQHDKLQQHHDKLQQHHTHLEEVQQQHEQELNDLKGMGEDQLKIDESSSGVKTMQKGVVPPGNRYTDISLTPLDSSSGDIATVPAEVQKINTQLHAGDPKNVKISSETNSVEFSERPVTVSAPRAVVPPASKVWYEVQCTYRYLGWICVGWATSDLFSKERRKIGEGRNGFAFNPAAEQKSNNGGQTRWGKGFKVKSGVVGVALDLVRREILFSVDGKWTKPMGVAFTNIPTDIKLFPAITGRCSSIQYNFGDNDFTFGPPDPTFVKLLDVI